jgi:TonB family protein
MLRAAREALGLSLPDVSSRTNIKPQILDAIERMDRQALPAQPYTMGFVRAYARELALPEDALMSRFRQEIGYEVRDRATRIAAPTRPASPDGGKELSVLIVLAVIGFVLFCVWKLLISASPELPEDASRFTFSKDDQSEAVAPYTGNQRPAETTDAVATSPEGTPAPVRQEEIEAPLAEETGPEAASPQVAPAEEAETAAPNDVQEEVAARPLRRLVAVEPVYPPLCEGAAEPVETITVAFTINGRGRPTGGRITSSTNPCFNGAALAALERWRYDPSTVNGENARQTTRFTFDRPY